MSDEKVRTDQGTAPAGQIQNVEISDSPTSLEEDDGTYESSMMDISKVVLVSSDIFKACPECGNADPTKDDVDDKINHYLGHGYRLLHVGQQTTHDQDGKPWQTTVAVMGKE